MYKHKMRMAGYEAIVDCSVAEGESLSTRELLRMEKDALLQILKTVKEPDGLLFRMARRHLGFTVDTLADYLKIEKEVIESWESENSKYGMVPFYVFLNLIKSEHLSKERDIKRAIEARPELLKFSPNELSSYNVISLFLSSTKDDWIFDEEKQEYGFRHNLLISLWQKEDGRFDLCYGYQEVAIVNSIDPFSDITILEEFDGDFSFFKKEFPNE